MIPVKQSSPENPLGPHKGGESENTSTGAIRTDMKVATVEDEGVYNILLGVYLCGL